MKLLPSHIHTSHQAISHSIQESEDCPRCCRWCGAMRWPGSAQIQHCQHWTQIQPDSPAFCPACAMGFLGMACSHCEPEVRIQLDAIPALAFTGSFEDDATFRSKEQHKASSCTDSCAPPCQRSSLPLPASTIDMCLLVLWPTLLFPFPIYILAYPNAEWTNGCMSLVVQ